MRISTRLRVRRQSCQRPGGNGSGISIWQARPAWALSRIRSSKSPRLFFNVSLIVIKAVFVCIAYEAAVAEDEYYLAVSQAFFHKAPSFLSGHDTKRGA
jgi:hypothetical protein